MNRYTAFNNEGENKLCRICLDDSDPHKKLIVPCRCSGTQKYVHESCLSRWRETQFSLRDVDKCEICLYNYKFNKITPYWFFRLGFNPDIHPYNRCFRISLIYSLLIIFIDMIFSPLDKNDNLINPLILGNSTISDSDKSNLYLCVYDVSLIAIFTTYVIIGIIYGKLKKFPGINAYLSILNTNYFMIISILFTLIVCCIFVRWYLPCLCLLLALNYILFATHMFNIYKINSQYMYSVCEYNISDDKERQKSIDDLDI